MGAFITRSGGYRIPTAASRDGAGPSFHGAQYANAGLAPPGAPVGGFIGGRSAVRAVHQAVARRYFDAWGTAYRYGGPRRAGQIRSAGPDAPRSRMPVYHPTRSWTRRLLNLQVWDAAAGRYRLNRRPPGQGDGGYVFHSSTGARRACRSRFRSPTSIRSTVPCGLQGDGN